MNPCTRSYGAIGALSLTPLLALSDSLIKVFGVLLVLWGVFGVHGVLLQPARYLSERRRLAISLLVSVTLVSCMELLLQGVALNLCQALGIYLPLLALLCPFATQSAFPAKEQIRALLRYSVTMVLLGLIREAVGTGSVLSNAQWLFGEEAAHWQIDLFAQSSAIHMVTLLPGALILLGLLLAAANALFKTSETALTESVIVAKEKRSP